MNENQLNIQRSATPISSRFPAGFNFAVVTTAILFLIAVSIWTVIESKKSLRENVASKLGTILEIESEAVNQWIEAQKQLAGFVAADHELAKILANADPADATQKLTELSDKLKNRSCLVMTADGEVIASKGKRWLNEQIPGFTDQFCETLSTGRITVSPILKHTTEDGRVAFSIVVAAPVVGNSGQSVGFVGIGYDLTDALTEVLKSSRSGKSGETIAISQAGDLISRSRFQEEHEFNYKIEFDPSATIDLTGTPDHRGVESVMATKWLPEYGLSLMTKMDEAEANAPVNRVLFFVWTLFSLVLLTAFSTLFYRWYLMRLRLVAREADLKKKVLGAYELEDKIGEGGMGVVFRAHHALLRRPTAIKILPPERSNRESIQRFEREVQFTSQLKHPNTISIYDYGRTEAGLFYYAMELLEGMSLDQLVELEGPLPDGRVVEVLKQTCHSLSEAHSLGLVHRDIKPANIMLCNRGGAYDTVKVLDFGMVRDQDSSHSGNHLLSGTPTYMAPECFTDPDLIDSRVDVFALGAVAFYMLTGRPLFDVSSFDELLDMHIKGANVLAKQHFERAIQSDEIFVSEALVSLVCDCLARLCDRPSSVDQILDRLSRSQSKTHWGRGSAEKWWTTLDKRHSSKGVSESVVKSRSASPLNETQAFEMKYVEALTP